MNTQRRLDINEQRGATLLPDLWDELSQALASVEEEGWEPMIVTAYRSMDEQAALYAQGREEIDTVNGLREKAGMDDISETENERKVTKAKPGSSLHNFKRAADIVNYPDGASEPEWDNSNFFKALFSHLEPLGWKWGGNFKSFADVDHFEK